MAWLFTEYGVKIWNFSFLPATSYSVNIQATVYLLIGKLS